MRKKTLASNYKWMLELGQGHKIVRIILNGIGLGVVCKAPFTIEITSAIDAENNELSIEVTNQWINRLIGDENFSNVSGYDLRPQLKQPLLIKDSQLLLINCHKMVDWYTNNEPEPLGPRSIFTTYPFYDKGDKLFPAGLLGPVDVRVSRIVPLD